MIQGYITRGTTIRGKSVNAGDILEMDADTFRQLSMTKDVIDAKDAPRAETPEAAEIPAESPPAIEPLKKPKGK